MHFCQRSPPSQGTPFRVKSSIGARSSELFPPGDLIKCGKLFRAQDLKISSLPAHVLTTHSAGRGVRDTAELPLRPFETYHPPRRFRILYQLGSNLHVYPPIYLRASGRTTMRTYLGIGPERRQDRPGGRGRAQSQRFGVYIRVHGTNDEA